MDVSSNQRRRTRKKKEKASDKEMKIPGFYYGIFIKYLYKLYTHKHERKKEDSHLCERIHPSAEEEERRTRTRVQRHQDINHKRTLGEDSWVLLNISSLDSCLMNIWCLTKRLNVKSTGAWGKQSQRQSCAKNVLHLNLSTVPESLQKFQASKQLVVLTTRH